jgi:hypothetical protein
VKGEQHVIDPDEPTLDDVFTSTEEVHPDRREHAKTPAHLNDDELARRTEEERLQAGLDDYDPDEVPPATEG